MIAVLRIGLLESSKIFARLYHGVAGADLA